MPRKDFSYNFMVKRCAWWFAWFTLRPSSFKFRNNVALIIWMIVSNACIFSQRAVFIFDTIQLTEELTRTFFCSHASRNIVFESCMILRPKESPHEKAVAISLGVPIQIWCYFRNSPRIAHILSFSIYKILNNSMWLKLDGKTYNFVRWRFILIKNPFIKLSFECVLTIMSISKDVFVWYYRCHNNCWRTENSVRLNVIAFYRLHSIKAKISFEFHLNVYMWSCNWGVTKNRENELLHDKRISRPINQNAVHLTTTKNFCWHRPIC